jgi:nitroreductase
MPSRTNPETKWCPADEAIRTRRAVRGFLPTPIALATVQEILTLAGMAPSGSNIQPWKVRVVAGDARDALCKAVLDRLDDPDGDPPKTEWEYYPVTWREPYIGRRRKTGWGLYGVLGVGRGDTEKSEAFRRKNFEFFDAPVGMIFTLDRDMELGSWLDLGIFLGNLTIAARGIGLDTCLQQSWATVYDTVQTHLRIPDEEIVVCGAALGHADPEALANAFSTDRIPLSDFATFEGFRGNAL